MMMIPDPLLHASIPHTEAHAVTDMADMIRRDGSRLYGGAGVEGCAYQASLCGVTASFTAAGDVMMLKTPDMQVMVTLAVTPVDDADGIERNSTVRTDVATRYIMGDAIALGVWHRHLCAYRRSMRSLHTVAA